MQKIIDGDGAVLSEAEIAMMKFSRKVALHSSQVCEQDIAELREHGFSDADIFDIASAAAARCFFARLGDAMGAQPDAQFNELSAQLRGALTVGRPISSDEPERASSSKDD